jgi:circadian clock protein KaiB
MTSQVFRFRLFVTGDAPNSAQAKANLTELCRRHLSHRHHVEIVDLLRFPQRALVDGIYITPTLVRLAPGPELRIVGSLSDAAPLLTALGIALDSG